MSVSSASTLDTTIDALWGYPILGGWLCVLGVLGEREEQREQQLSSSDGILEGFRSYAESFVLYKTKASGKKT